MPGTLWIASSDLLCVYPDGTEVHAVARLASPTRRGDGLWVSTFAVDTLHDPQEMVGEDSLQALCMAMSMIRALLERFVEQGGRVLSPEDRTDFPIEATFGLMGAANRTQSAA
jgi:uncharacterized protein DUF6968